MRETLYRSNPIPVVDTPENTDAGILMVLLPGFGPKRTQGQGELLGQSSPPKGLILSAQIDRGPVVKEVLGWLKRAGFDVKSQEKRFALSVWPDAFSGECHGPQMVPKLVDQSEAFCQDVMRRRPKLLILVSCYLLDALNTPTMQEKLALVFGKPLTPPSKLTDTRLSAKIQYWQSTVMLAVPVPGKNTTPAFVQALTDALAKRLVMGHS